MIQSIIMNKKIKRICRCCGKSFYIYRCALNQVGRPGKYCSKKCYWLDMCNRKGKECSHWKGGKHKTKIGYILIKVYNHPFSNSIGYYPEHRLIMEKHIGRYLKPTEEIHHINHIKNDNRIENLMLCNNKSIHMRNHKNNLHST